MKKKKIVLLPLDERPCNFKFPYQIFQTDFMDIVRPNVLGNKKIPADLEQVRSFLKTECKDADYAVLALDTLLYGGLIPSRLHQFSKQEVLERLNLLRQIKEENPKLIIYAFECIMRCPKYSSSDEEPDYYKDCGEQIHQYGITLQKENLGITVEWDKESLLNQIHAENLNDYTSRRSFNLSINLKTVELVKEGVLDFLVIPQDDSAPYGYTAMDQMTIRQYIAENMLQNRIYIYPGADEVAMTLLAKVANHIHQKVPKTYVKYASIQAPFSTPPYEDRPLGETIKSHLMAANCLLVNSVEDADFILCLSAPAKGMQEADCQPVITSNYTTSRNLAEFVYFIKHAIKKSKLVTIGDNSYVNGGDLELFSMLQQEDLLFKLAGYAGWNTSANTIGTSIAQGVVSLYQGQTKASLDFLALRYLEDIGYCAHVRKEVTDTILESLGMNYFDIKEEQGTVSSIIQERLIQFFTERFPAVAPHLHVTSVRMPWRRMFEVDIDANYQS